MAYATYTDLTDVLGPTIAAELTAESGTSIDSTYANAVIGDAEGIINGYLGSRTYSTAETATLKTHTLVIARSLLLSRRLAGRYDAALDADLARTYEWLKDVSTGKYGIFGTPGAVTSTGTSGGIWRSNTQIYDTTYYRGGF